MGVHVYESIMILRVGGKHWKNIQTICEWKDLIKVHI